MNLGVWYFENYQLENQTNYHNNNADRYDNLVALLNRFQFILALKVIHG